MSGGQCPCPHLVMTPYCGARVVVPPPGGPREPLHQCDPCLPRSGQHGRDISPLYTMDRDQTGVLARHRDKLLQSFNSQQVKQSRHVADV